MVRKDSLPMKALSLLIVLMLSALPVKASENIELKKKQAYFYGFVTGVGAALCGMVVDEQITKEYAQYFLPSLVKELSRNPSSKDIKSELKKAQSAVMKTDGCKGVFQ